MSKSKSTTSALMPFKFQGHDISVITHDSGEQWFFAKEVCAVLGLENVSMAISRLDVDEKGIISTDTLGGPQEMLIISEPGLYELTRSSRKQVAKKFQRWVNHEVLPSIRKTGAYASHVSGQSGVTMAMLLEYQVFMEQLGQFTDRDRLMVGDIARTQLQRTTGLLPPGATGSITYTGFDMEDILRTVAPRLAASQIRKIIGEAGKRIAQEYRSRNAGQEPEKTQRFVDGKSRGVNWYKAEDAEWATPILQSYLSTIGML